MASESITFSKDTFMDIAERRFEKYTTFKEYNVPEGTKVIGKYAFRGCIKLEKVTIPESVIEIGEGAFFSCHSLKSFRFPKNISSYNNKLFYGCKNLRDLYIPTAIKRYHIESFVGLNKCRLHIPKGEKAIVKDWVIYKRFISIIEDYE